MNDRMNTVGYAGQKRRMDTSGTSSSFSFSDVGELPYTNNFFYMFDLHILCILWYWYV